MRKVFKFNYDPQASNLTVLTKYFLLHPKNCETLEFGSRKHPMNFQSIMFSFYYRKNYFRRP